MKIFFFTILLCSLSFSSYAFSKKLAYVPGEILVKYKKKNSISSLSAKIKSRGDAHLRNLNNGGLSHIKLGNKRDFNSALEEYKKNPDVEYAQPNYIYRILATTPNDARYTQQWGFKNTGQTIVTAGGPDTPASTHNPGTSGSDMNLESVWDYITDCSSVVVAVVDTGVNYNHEDLNANMWDGGGSYPHHGYDFVTNTNDPLDRHGHGTHVAGTIGAVGNNSVGGTGVCWNAKIMALRVLDATGAGTTAQIVQALDFAVAQGAKVVNMSLGGTSYDTAFNNSINAAQSSGVLLVVAAGNASSNNESAATYPCNYTQSNVLCVAALDQNYSLASYSNYGAVSVDLGAPGTNIVSTWPGTETTISDLLTSGWTLTGTPSAEWAYKSLNFGAPTNTLVNPSTYNYSTAKYSNSLEDTIWKSFDTTGANVSLLDFYVMYDLESNKDYLGVLANSTGVNPYITGDVLGAYSGSTGGYRYLETYDISSYIGANTTLGFLLQTDASGVDLGVNISSFAIRNLSYNTNSYNVISGTSMASPHVAGLAALLFAYNSNYTYSDVITAIKTGGTTLSSLAGKTVTGKAANALGALTYISAPSGVSANILP